MTQFAGIAYIGKSARAPASLQGFISFRAGMEQRDLKGDETVAVLRIGTTDCYHVLLLDQASALPDIEKELAGIDAALGAKARRRLSSLLAKAGRK